MDDDTDHDALFDRLDRLVATSTATPLRDRRLILSLEADLRAVRAALHARREDCAQKLNIAGAHSAAMTAYSRIAYLGRGSASAPTTK